MKNNSKAVFPLWYIEYIDCHALVFVVFIKSLFFFILLYFLQHNIGKIDVLCVCFMTSQPRFYPMNVLLLVKIQATSLCYFYIVVQVSGMWNLVVTIPGPAV